MSDFQSGAKEQVLLVLTGEQDVSSGTDFQVIPHSGNPSGPNKPYSRGQTDEVNPELQVQDNAVRGFTVPFSYQGIWRYSLHDTPLQMVMGNAWSAAVSVAGTDIASTIAAGVNKFTSATATKFSDFTAQVPCPVWIKRDGSSALAHFAIALAVEDTETTLVVGLGTASGSDPSDGVFGVSLGTETAGDNVTVMHSGCLKNGSTEYYAMIERAQPGVGIFYVGFGMFCTQADFTTQKGSDPIASFTFLGKNADDATTTFGTGSNTAAGTFKAFNAGKDLQFFGEGGLTTTSSAADTVAGFFPQSSNLTVASAGNPIDPMGIDGPFAHVKDTVVVTGRFSLYTNLAGRLIGQKQKTDVDSSLFWANKKTVGSTTNAYCWWVPRVQYENTDQEGGGQGGSSMTPMTWQSAKHATYGITLAVTRFSALP